MPLSIYKKLGLKVIKINISLQFVNKSTKRPLGIVEDVFIKAGKFIFLMDFIVLDFEEDKNMPLILGLPFLYMNKAQLIFMRALSHFE